MMVADKVFTLSYLRAPRWVGVGACADMHLRHAKSADLPFLTSLLANNECLCTLGKEKNREDWVSIGQTYVNGVLNTELATWENCATRYSDASSALWVLEDTGKADGSAPVVGCIGCIANAKDSEVELVRMYVDPNYRRRGLGRQLFDHLHMHACGIRAKRIHLSTPSVNEPGLAFYRSLGFVTANTFVVDDFAPHTLQLSVLERLIANDAPLLNASASAVQAYFACQCGATDAEQIAIMPALGIAKLEAMQAAAEEVATSGRDDEARHAGFEWATAIGNFIA